MGCQFELLHWLPRTAPNTGTLLPFTPGDYVAFAQAQLVRRPVPGTTWSRIGRIQARNLKTRSAAVPSLGELRRVMARRRPSSPSILIDWPAEPAWCAKKPAFPTGRGKHVSTDKDPCDALQSLVALETKVMLQFPYREASRIRGNKRDSHKT